MMLKLVAVLLAFIVVVLVLAAMKPGTYRIERSITINASAENIFGLIDDFHRWAEWAPQEADATMTKSYSGAEKGAGAVLDWSGKGSTGAGRMAITEAKSPTKVVLVADWVRPFRAHNVNVFTLEPGSANASTKVIWAMQGTNVFVLKVMSVFMNMDRFMGRHFESGLSNLKSAAERP